MRHKPATSLLQSFKGLSKSEQNAFFKLAERNAYFSFTPAELEKGDRESLGYIAQTSHQGTLILPRLVKAWLAKIVGQEDKIVVGEQEQQLSHISSENESILTHSWPILLEDVEGAQTVSTPIFQVTAELCFDTQQSRQASTDEADLNSFTMRLGHSRVEITLLHPEVAIAARRTIGRPSSSAELSQSFLLNANSNLRSSATLFKEIPDWELLVAGGHQEDCGMPSFDQHGGQSLY